MDSAAVLSTSLSKSQKRTTDEQKSENANENVSIDDEGIKKLKRFKCMEAETSKFNLITTTNNSKLMENFCLKSTRNIINENGINVLSPISEISNNLSEAVLNADETRDNTPIKKIENIFAKRKMLQYFGKNIFDKNTLTTNSVVPQEIQQNIEIKLNQKHFDFPKGQTSLSANNKKIVVENDVYKNEMAIDDEIALYDDESFLQSNDEFIPQNSNGNTLLPIEPSAQRFKIVKKFTTNNSSLRSLQNDTRNSQFRAFHSLSSTCSIESSTDDECMEFFEMESLDDISNINLPRNLNTLINGKIQNSPTLNTNIDVTPRQRSTVRRCLSMTTENDQHLQIQMKNITGLKEIHEETYQKLNLSKQNDPLSTYNFKRPEPPSTTADISPIQNKRFRKNDKENFNNSNVTDSFDLSQVVDKRPTLTKSFSMNDTEILLALTRSEHKDEPDLVGDFSKPFALPLIKGQHSDLKTISSETVARLIKGEFDDKIESYKIIDCRYPYEYEGGHIRGAINLYMQNQILTEFLTQTKTEQEQQKQLEDMRANNNNSKRNIIIFHCEFSSERGPKLLRFLRNNDRVRNINAYPALDYPEIYLLHNGYKAFYETYADLCIPSAYRPMLEPSYNAEYKHFRSKSKLWNGDGTNTTKKFGSRLIL